MIQSFGQLSIQDVESSEISLLARWKTFPEGIMWRLDDLARITILVIGIGSPAEEEYLFHKYLSIIKAYTKILFTNHMIQTTTAALVLSNEFNLGKDNKGNMVCNWI
jgi:hypothetical protein